jgi:hypothetical protein
MALNTYFDQFTDTAEQDLAEDLIVESIEIHGHNVYYVPKTLVNFDGVYGEDDLSEYNSAYQIEMYIKNVDGFGGMGDLMTKVGFQINDSMNLTVARRTFGELVTAEEPARTRPLEGDLIFFPLNQKLFQIRFVEHEAAFYQFGALYTWDLSIELFEYSGERLNTGIAAIDNIERDHSTVSITGAILTDLDMMITDSDGFPIVSSYLDEEVEGTYFTDSPEIEVEGEDYIDFTDANPFGEP